VGVIDEERGDATEQVEVREAERERKESEVEWS